MKRELNTVSLSNLSHQSLIQLEKNSQIISIIGKKIEEQTAKKVNKVQLIDIDELQLSDNQEKKQNHANLLKAAKQSLSSDSQLCESEAKDEEYIPQLESSQSESVQKYRFYRLRMRDLKSISKQEFERQLLPNEPIEIIDLKPENIERNQQKKQQVKISFKEEAGGRTTKKTKMEFLLKNKGVSLKAYKNKKIIKSLEKISKQLS